MHTQTSSEDSIHSKNSSGNSNQRAQNIKYVLKGVVIKSKSKNIAASFHFCYTNNYLPKMKTPFNFHYSEIKSAE